jgi:hypothetical protein
MTSTPCDPTGPVPSHKAGQCFSTTLMVLSLLGAASSLLVPSAVRAQQTGYGQTLGGTTMEQQVYDGGGSRPGSGSILNTTNPLDLMNKIRRGTALDDATPPSSAIDQALRELDSHPAQKAVLKPPGAEAAGPGSGATVSNQPATPVRPVPAPR